MTDDTINYDAKVQEALRHVVRSVLSDTVKDGLKGEHHFFVAFKTQAEGVDIPQHLISRFPDEMTIVIQHKFWGLAVHDDYFEIGLSFNQNPEHLVIPFDAIVGFVDPSVQFALQFHDGADLADGTDTTDEDDLAALEELNYTNEEILQAAPVKKETTKSEDQQKSDGDNIVTLDAFRRK